MSVFLYELRIAKSKTGWFANSVNSGLRLLKILKSASVVLLAIVLSLPMTS